MTRLDMNKVNKLIEDGKQRIEKYNDEFMLLNCLTIAKKKNGEGEGKEGEGDEEGGEMTPPPGGEGGDEESGESPESDEEGGLDDEMLGDVQPESTETTQA